MDLFKKHNVSFILMLTALIGLFIVQAFWITESIHTHNQKIKTALIQSGSKIKEEIEQDFYCFVLHTQTDIMADEHLAIVKSQANGFTDTVRDFVLRQSDTTLAYPKYEFNYPVPTRLQMELRFDYLIDGIAHQNAAIPVVQEITDEYRKLAIIDSVTNTRVAYSSTIGRIIEKNTKAVLPGSSIGYVISHAGSGRLVYASTPNPFSGKVMELTLYDDPLKFRQPYLLTVYSEWPYLQIFRSLWHFLLATILILLIGAIVFYYWLSTWRKERLISAFQKDMMHSISHELNTPVFNIRMAAQAFQRIQNENPHESSKYVEIIQKESERMAENMAMLMDYVQIEEKPFQLDRKRIELNQLVLKVVEMFNTRLEASPENIKVIPSENQSIWINGDEMHMINILYNLLDNALKYASDKPVQVNIYCEAKHKKAVIRIEDNCIPIPPGLREKVFEKYYRAVTKDSKKIKGYGLGLYYVKLIINKMKGTIRIGTSGMGGNAFVINLPVINTKFDWIWK